MMQEKESRDRLIKALENGWGFSNLIIKDKGTSRNCIWVKKPDCGEWFAQKASSDEEPLDALLDAAGVP